MGAHQSHAVDLFGRRQQSATAQHRAPLSAPPRAAHSDPFRIDGPAVISFSGGRTSGYMLHRVLRAHGGTLPDDVLVCFANTGREMPATLDFVRDCGAAWNVPIRWLEYRRDADTGRVWAEEVSHNSASRAGEPMEAVIAARGFLFNTRQIYCSGELKTRTVRRFVRATCGWTTWRQVIGLRADQPDAGRVVKARERAQFDAEYAGVEFPLHDAGLTADEVAAFWAAQPFDLHLKGKWEGNCDGCPRKRRVAIARMFRDHPERMDWWPRRETEMAGRTREPSGAVFRLDWGSYAAVRALEFDQGRLDLDAEDDGLDVFAACGLGCGV